MIHKFAAVLAVAAVGCSATAASASTVRFGRINPIVRSASADANFTIPYMSAAKYVGTSNLRNMEITIRPRLRNLAALESYAQAASNPRSHYYRRFLTPQQIGDAFGTPAATYQREADYFRSFGLRVHVWPQRLDMQVIGPQAGMERAFGTRFGTFQRYGVNFVGPVGAVHVPASLQIGSFRNLATVPELHRPLLATQPAQPVAGGFSPARGEGLSPQEIASVYDYSGAYAAGFTGKNINLGILATGGISPADVPNFKTFVNLKNSSSVVTQVDGTQSGDVPPPAVTAPCTANTSGEPTAACDPEDLEAQLDTEQAASLAPDANVLFYLSFNGTEQGIDDSADEIDQALADNKADILSYSVGGCEVFNAALGATGPLGNLGLLDTDSDPLYADAAAQGIAVFVSSGDTGPNECQRLTGDSDVPSPSYPATDPNVVSVGGTTTPVDYNGRLDGPLTVWGVQTETGGAEGVGQSTLFATPDYQTAAGLSSVCTMRCEPDVVLNADPITGDVLLADSAPGLGGTTEEPIGGTSAAAPGMAAMWALVLSACKQTPACTAPATAGIGTTPAVPAYRLGNPNYSMYPVLTDATKYAQTFYDITYGESGVPPYATQLLQSEGVIPNAYISCPPCDPGVESAGVGYDQATGLGAPFARALIKAVVGV